MKKILTKSGVPIVPFLILVVYINCSLVLLKYSLFLFIGFWFLVSLVFFGRVMLEYSARSEEEKFYLSEEETNDEKKEIQNEKDL